MPTLNQNNFQYLFLGGILGEALSLPFIANYLKENKSLLIKQGIDKENIHFTTLNSFSSAEANADKLIKILRSRFENRKKKIIIIGHSKGCLEALLCVTKHFHEAQRYVQKVMCFSPPLKGSSLFTKRNNHYFDKVVFHILDKSQKVIAGVKCLEPNFYSDKVKNCINNSEELKKFIAENLLVVRGYKRQNKDVAWIIKPTHHILKLANAENDGLVTLEDQRLEGIKYNELTLEMDHSDLFTSSLITNESKDFKNYYINEFFSYARGEQTFFSLQRQLSVKPSEYENKNLRLRPHSFQPQ